MKGILFDLDGTLLNTSALIINSFRYTIQKHCHYDIDPDLVRTYFGKPLRTTLTALVPDNTEEALKTYLSYNLLHHDRLTTIFPGTVEGLERLYARGLRMAVVTSKIQQMALRGLKLFGLERYFAAIIAYEQCRHYKPHPEPVELAATALALAPADCLMVGDSQFDILCGKNAGAQTAAVRWTEVSWPAILAIKPDYILDNMTDLPAIVGWPEHV